MPSDFAIPESLKGSGGFRGRQDVGQRWFSFLTRDAGLEPGDAVLDVGCGLGRIAVPLLAYVTGRYEGFDIDAAAIAWCRENITARAPNFHFKAVDLRSTFYNPGGAGPADSFEFPYESGSFEVVFLASVFTHLLTETVANYLSEIQRVLKPGGRVVASYFLLNDDSERAIAAGSARPAFPHRVGRCRVSDPKRPEAAVAHEEQAIRALYRDRGLSLSDIRYGSWPGRPSAESNQDIIFAVKV